jgi:hypothetical protein
MTDVFLSYKREDEARVGRLVQALEKAGLKVWWDRGLPGGESWRANIQGALDGAKCVIVAWTHESVGPAGDFVRDEAGQAKARGILVPVILERGVRPPLGFGELQAIDLSHWRGNTSDPFFRDLVAACQAKLEGRAVPPARGPMARLVRRLTIGSVASALTAGLFAFAMNIMSVQDHACTVQLGQPALGDACGALGLGNQPTHAERVAFEALPPGDCAALSDYRTRFEDSPLRALADSRLADRSVRSEEQWVPFARQNPVMFSPADGAPSSTEAAAQAAALERARPQAERLCRNFAASTLFRFNGATPVAQSWSCERRGGGFVCGFDGVAQCDIDEKQIIEHVSCGGAP